MIKEVIEEAGTIIITAICILICIVAVVSFLIGTMF